MNGCFDGCLGIQHLNYYSTPTLEEEQPDIVIIHGEIVNGLIEIAEKCTNSGVEKVFISSLITCSRVDESRIDEINRLLKERCEALDVTFIDNDNIKNSSLWKDGIHLTDDGKTMLAKNYLYYFNHFLYHNMYFQSWV